MPGVSCVGMGSDLVRKDLVDAQDWAGMTALTAQCLAWVRKARGQAIYTGIEHLGHLSHGAGYGSRHRRLVRQDFWLQGQGGQQLLLCLRHGPWAHRGDEGRAEPPCHIAILVSDFEAAMADLKAKGVETARAEHQAHGQGRLPQEPRSGGEHGASAVDGLVLQPQFTNKPTRR